MPSSILSRAGNPVDQTGAGRFDLVRGGAAAVEVASREKTRPIRWSRCHGVTVAAWLAAGGAVAAVAAGLEAAGSGCGFCTGTSEFVAEASANAVLRRRVDNQPLLAGFLRDRISPQGEDGFNLDVGVPPFVAGLADGLGCTGTQSMSIRALSP